MKWHEDVARADTHAKTHPQQRGAPPHWNRCNFVGDDGERCRKFEGHDGEHEPYVPKERHGD
jgi:hypothetical protein